MIGVACLIKTVQAAASNFLKENYIMQEYLSEKNY